MNIGILADDLNFYDNRTSFHAGFTYEKMISDKVALQPEMLYSAEGGKSGKTTLALNYLNIPILAKFYLTDGFNLQTGLQLGFLLNAKLKSDIIS